MDGNGNGGCCIARWSDVGYDMSKMDKIMLKFRPIAPKPVSANGSSSGASDDSHNSPRGGRHAKPASRGRRKTTTSTTASNNNNNKGGKKRKSVSPEKQVTLLPLFPEAPDLSPTKQPNNNNQIWLNFDNSNGNNNNNNNNNYYNY